MKREHCSSEIFRSLYSGAKQFKVYPKFGVGKKVMLLPKSKGFILCVVVILGNLSP